MAVNRQGVCVTSSLVLNFAAGEGSCQPPLSPQLVHRYQHTVVPVEAGSREVRHQPEVLQLAVVEQGCLG